MPSRWTATFAGHAQDAGLGAEPAAAPPVSDAAAGLRLDDAQRDPGQPMERATTEDRTRRRPTPAWVPVVLVAVVYAVLSAFANGSAWAHGVAHTLQTSGGNDVGEEVWFLAETPWILLHGHNPFANDWLNTPVGVDLMDNTTMPVLGVLFAPVTLLFGPVATFNVVLDVSIWASAMSFFLMARRFVRWWPAAFVGGLLYGFSPYTAAVGNGHLFLLFQAAPPLIILFLDRFLRSDTASPWWAGFWVGACYVVQFYVSTEAFACLLVMTLWAVVLALAYVLWRRPAVDWARLARLGACAVAVVVIFTGYAAWTAVDGPEHVNGPVQSLSATAGQSTDPVGLVVPTLNQRFTLGHTALGNTLVAARDPQWHLVLDSLIENGTYVGIPLLVALVAAVAVLRRRRVVQFSAVMGASALVISMGSRLHVAGHRTPIRLPFIVFTHLPLFDSSVAARWITYFWLFAALILAVTIDAVRARLTARTPRGSGLAALGVCTLLAACVLVPLVPAWPYASASVRRAGLVHRRRPVPPPGHHRRRLPVGQPVGLLGHVVAGRGGPPLQDDGWLRHLRQPGGHHRPGRAGHAARGDVDRVRGRRHADPLPRRRALPTARRGRQHRGGRPDRGRGAVRGADPRSGPGPTREHRGRVALAHV